MMDLAQGRDLAAYRLIPFRAVEELERPILALDVIMHAIHLRKAALPEQGQNLEAAVDEVADGVVGGLASIGGPQLCRVGFRERLAAAREWFRAGSIGRIAGITICALADRA